MDLFSASLLVLLTLQRSGASIILHEAGKVYSTALAVLLGEVIKQIVCFIIAIYQIRQDVNVRLPTIDQKGSSESVRLAIQDYTPCINIFFNKVFNKNALTVFIPAALYVVQNNLWLYASARIDPSTFQALWQLRLIPTAFLSQVVLKKNLGIRHWLSLCVILGGVITIQQAIKGDATMTAEAQRSSMTAIAALALAALCASLAGVLLEKLFKTEGTNLWISNFQLSAFSIIPALCVIFFDIRKQDAASFASIDVFTKSFMPWTAVLIQGLAGILVALTTKYAGCIAGSISGIASIAVTHLFQMIMGKGTDALKELSFVAGFILVAIGVTTYTLLGTNASTTITANDAEDDIRGEGRVHLEMHASPTKDNYWLPLNQGIDGQEDEDLSLSTLRDEDQDPFSQKYADAEDGQQGHIQHS